MLQRGHEHAVVTGRVGLQERLFLGDRAGGQRGVRLGAAGQARGAEKLCAGAPGSPANTWFHTPLVQPSRLVLRTRNCCSEPLITVPPVNDESAMNPPLAYCGPAEQ
jgi:hypothetical protein